MSSNKIDVSQEGYIKLINTIYRNLEEERDLALDKYRLYDQKMDQPQDYVMMGKPAATFLNLASSRSDALFNMSKEIKGLVFSKNDGESGNSGGRSNSDEERKMMEALVAQTKREQQDKNQDEDLTGDIEKE